MACSAGRLSLTRSVAAAAAAWAADDDDFASKTIKFRLKTAQKQKKSNNYNTHTLTRDIGVAKTIYILRITWLK